MATKKPPHYRLITHNTVVFEGFYDNCDFGLFLNHNHNL